MIPILHLYPNASCLSSYSTFECDAKEQMLDKQKELMGSLDEGLGAQTENGST